MNSAAAWDPTRLPPQSGKTIVVTGGNAGIGYFVSEQLAGAGARIVMASRSAEKAATAAASIRERVPGAVVDFVKLDLSSLGSVREAAAAIRKLGAIDVLVNNAGATSGSSKRVLTEDGLEFVVGSNAFGPFALTALVFPVLKDGARVVSLGSLSTKMVGLDPQNLQSERGRYNFFRAYAYSKHAMHAFAFELQRKLTAAGSGVESLLAHPGLRGRPARRSAPRDQRQGQGTRRGFGGDLPGQGSRCVADRPRRDRSRRSWRTVLRPAPERLRPPRAGRSRRLERQRRIRRGVLAPGRSGHGHHLRALGEVPGPGRSQQGASGI
ncbi:MAG: SDR family NAD(P)-dependent oxidoreductase [Galbitalea sp.]